MAKAIDPFEEYLRKKKVEMLEHQYRSHKDRTSTTEEEPSPPAPSNDDPEVEARLKEEVDDFFQDSQSAAAELFSKAASMSDDKVEEIKEALDDVFEEEAPKPETAEDEGGTFVDFFRQVQEEFPGRGRKRADPAGEVVPTVESGPELASPAPPAAAPPPAPAVAPAPPPVPRTPELPDLEAMAAEVSTDDLDLDSGAGLHDADRLSLAEILLAQPGAVDLERKVEVLCRLVAKIAERVNLPEGELIEALIKAGVEF